MVYQYRRKDSDLNSQLKYKKCLLNLNKKEAKENQLIYDKKFLQWPIAKDAIRKQFELFIKGSEGPPSNFDFFITDNKDDVFSGEVVKGTDAISMQFTTRPWNVSYEYYENGRWVGGSIGVEHGGAIHFSLSNLGDVTAWVYLPSIKEPKRRDEISPGGGGQKDLTNEKLNEKRLEGQFSYAKKILTAYKVTKTKKHCVVLLRTFDSPFNITPKSIRRLIKIGVKIAWEFSYTGKISLTRRLKINTAQLFRSIMLFASKHFATLVLGVMASLIAALLFSYYNTAPR